VKPADSWDMDEIGIAICVYMNQAVVGTSSTTRSHEKSPENREWVSVIEAISATGSRTYLVIFKGKSLQSTWFKHEKIPDWLYITSENGLTSYDIGQIWLHQIFLPESDRNGKPNSLMWDCHSHFHH
jgi:DDE superfamily endonuclease